jgi:hypothetical protein
MSTTLTHCRNCGHRLFAWDQFCSQCGQDTLDHPPTLWEFVHEWVLHYLAFEGKLWKSLWGLIAKPGFLTLEYLAGRKQRYVWPLRLVLTLGLLFFVAIKLFPPVQNPVVVDSPEEMREVVRAIGASPPPSAPEAAASKASHRPASASPQDPASVMQEAMRTSDPFELGDFEPQLPVAAQQSIQQARARWRADAGAEMRRIGNKLLAMAPYAVLLSLPFFAGLLKLLYWRLAYGAHFVFAMHLHAAWYLMLLLATLTPWAFVHGAVWFWSNLYPLLALKRVHHAGWASTLAKATLLVLMHWILIGLGLTLLLLLGALSA